MGCSQDSAMRMLLHPFHMLNEYGTAVVHNEWPCFHLNPSLQLTSHGAEVLRFEQKLTWVDVCCLERRVHGLQAIYCHESVASSLQCAQLSKKSCGPKWIVLLPPQPNIPRYKPSDEGLQFGFSNDNSHGMLDADWEEWHGLQARHCHEAGAVSSFPYV